MRPFAAQRQAGNPAEGAAEGQPHQEFQNVHRHAFEGFSRVLQPACPAAASKSTAEEKFDHRQEGSQVVRRNCVQMMQPAPRPAAIGTMAAMVPYHLIPARSPAATGVAELAAMQGIMIAASVGASLWYALYALLAR